MNIELSLSHIGARIKSLREGAGLSQVEAARLAGQDWSYLGRIERGTADPSIEKLMKLATVFGVNIAQFFADETRPPPPQLQIEKVNLPTLPREKIHEVEHQLGVGENALVGGMETIALGHDPDRRCRQRYATAPGNAAQFARRRSLALGAPPDTDKVSRLYGKSSYIESGQVLFPREAPWLASFFEELLAFPGGRHDDQVDALAQLLAWYSSHQVSDGPGGAPEEGNPYRYGMDPNDPHGDCDDPDDPENDPWDPRNRD